MSPRTLAIVTTLFAATLSVAAARAAEDPEPGVLLLLNGNLVEGAIARRGDYYQVTRGNGELSIPARQVEVVCRSIDEAYNRLRNRAANDAAAHVDLARWCLRNNLTDHAARELLDARAADPDLRDVVLVEKQLELQLRELAARTERAKLAIPRPDSAVVPAAGQSGQPTASHAEFEDEPRQPIAPSSEARAQFVRSIQPMLVHSCGTTGCHQPGGAPPLTLERMAIAGGGNRAALERNLTSVLGLVDAEQPDDSQLIDLAFREHGASNFRSRPLSPRQAEILLAWVRLAVGWEPPVEEDSALPDAEPMGEEFTMDFGDGPVSLGGQNSSQANQPAPPIESTPPGDAAQTETDQRSGVSAERQLPQTKRPQPASAPRPLALPASASDDPFDPAEFHRRIELRAVSQESAAKQNSGEANPEPGAADVPTTEPKAAESATPTSPALPQS